MRVVGRNGMAEAFVAPSNVTTSASVPVYGDAVHFLARHFATLLRVASRSRWQRGHSVNRGGNGYRRNGYSLNKITQPHHISIARHVPPYTSNNSQIINVPGTESCTGMPLNCSQTVPEMTLDSGVKFGNHKDLCTLFVIEDFP
jgi:hypothetical protein